MTLARAAVSSAGAARSLIAWRAMPRAVRVRGGAAAGRHRRLRRSTTPRRCSAVGLVPRRRSTTRSSSAPRCCASPAPRCVPGERLAWALMAVALASLGGRGTCTGRSCSPTSPRRRSRRSPTRCGCGFLPAAYVGDRAADPRAASRTRLAALARRRDRGAHRGRARAPRSCSTRCRRHRRRHRPRSRRTSPIRSATCSCSASWSAR